MAMTDLKDAKPALVAREDQRLLERATRRSAFARLRFGALVIVVLLLHAALLAYFLYRDNDATLETAQIEETPIEVVVEKPPEPPPPAPKAAKPPPPPEPTRAPPPPEPPKVPPPPVKEDLSPATSAPRAVQDKQMVDSKQAQPKTASPKTTAAPPSAPPSEAESKPAPAAEAKAAKPADDKPDAEALDKAKPEVKSKPDVKETKGKPKVKTTGAKSAAQQLAGLQGLQGLSIEAPAPRSTVGGGTEDMRYLAEVQGLIARRVHQLPRVKQYQAAGSVTISLHIDHDGRMTHVGYARRSGNPEMDQVVLNAVTQASPFPPPPSVVGNDFYFTNNFDGQLPRFTR